LGANPGLGKRAEHHGHSTKLHVPRPQLGPPGLRGRHQRHRSAAQTRRRLINAGTQYPLIAVIETKSGSGADLAFLAGRLRVERKIGGPTGQKL
jgi:hypothetical protein